MKEEAWLSEEPAKTQAIVESRISQLEHYDHFGDAKHLNERLSELRWKNAFRIYLTLVPPRIY